MHEVVYSLGIILLAFIWRVRDFSYYYRTFVSDDTSLEMHTTLSSMMDRFDRASSLLLMNLNMNGDGDEYEYEGEDDATGRERSSAAAVDDAEQEMRNLHLAKPPKYTQSRQQQQQQLQQQVGNSQEQTEDTNATPILVIFNPGLHATRRQHLYAALALSPTLEPPVEGDDDDR